MAAKRATATVVDLPVAPMRTAAAAASKGLDVIADPKMLKVQTQAVQLTAQLTATAVTDQRTYAAAVELCKVSKGVIDFLDESFKDPIADANRLHKGLIKLRDVTFGATALSAARDMVSRRAGGWWQQEQARQRQAQIEEQRKLDEEAELARALEVEELQVAGHVDAAEELVAAPLVPVAAPAPEPVVPKIASAAPIETWKYEIAQSMGDQLRALVKELRAGLPGPRSLDVAEQLDRLVAFAIFDDKRVGDRVRSLKGDCQIPGVRVWPEASVRTGAA